jgi:hypothetical protein
MTSIYNTADWQAGTCLYARLLACCLLLVIVSQTSAVFIDSKGTFVYSLIFIFCLYLYLSTY